MFLFCILIGWISGVASMGRFLSPTLLSCAPWVWCLTLLFIISSIGHFALVKQSWYKFLFSIFLALSSFFAGQYYADQSLEKRLLNRYTEATNTSEIVYIEKIDERSNTEDQILIKQKAKVLSHQNISSVEILLYHKQSNHHKQFEIGKYYQVNGNLKPAHSYAVNGVFDQEKWLIQQNIMGTMQIQNIQELSENEISSLGYFKVVNENQTWLSFIKRHIESYRLNFRNFIERQPLKNKGLLLALLTGDESLLERPVQEQFKTLGVSHLLAISGPHVLILAVIFCFLVNVIISRFFPQLFLKLPRPYLLIFPFLFCVIAYTAFVGFEIPAMRTCLTVFLIALVLLLKQQVSALKLLLLSASILLFLDPFSILSAAFWLSYGACFILIRVYQTIVQEPNHVEHTVITWKTRLWTFFSVLIESQWKVFLALFPLVAIIFQQISWISPLINLIAIPLIGIVVVPLEVIGACLKIISDPLALIFFHCADWTISFLLCCFDLLQSIFQPQLSWLALTPWMIACIALGIFILFLPKGILPKSWAILCFIPFLFGIKNENLFELNIIDVGQGQAIFLNTPEQKILIDTGGSYDENKFSIGKQVIVPYLMGQGINQLDKVILSHLDQDHAGAFENVNSAIKIKEIYSNQQDLRFDKLDFHYCHQGLNWQFKDIKIEVLSPLKENLQFVNGDQNEMSCVIYVQVEQAKPYKNFLIMGDAGWETEFWLLKNYPDLHVDVLILGHHGSQNSSSFDFLKQINPKLAIASAGYQNRYNHPSPIVMARLNALSIPFESTIKKGNIQFALNGKREMKIEYLRDQNKWLIRK